MVRADNGGVSRGYAGKKLRLLVIKALREGASAAAGIESIRRLSWFDILPFPMGAFLPHFKERVAKKHSIRKIST